MVHIKRVNCENRLLLAIINSSLYLLKLKNPVSHSHPLTRAVEKYTEYKDGKITWEDCMDFDFSVF